MQIRTTTMPAPPRMFKSRDKNAHAWAPDIRGHTGTRVRNFCTQYASPDAAPPPAGLAEGGLVLVGGSLRHW